MAALPPLDPSQPPSYTEVGNLPMSPQISSGPLSLTITNTRIYSASNPSRTLYELSQPILTGQAKTFGIEKFVYRVKGGESVEGCTGDAGSDTKSTDNINKEKLPVGVKSAEKSSPVEIGTGGASNSLNSEQDVFKARRSSMLDVGPSLPRSPSEGPRIAYSRRHIYDVKRLWFIHVGDVVYIEGVSKHTYKDAYLQRLPIKSSWKIKASAEPKALGWKCEIGGGIKDTITGKSKEDRVYVWRDKDSKTIAAEYREEMGEGETVAGTKQGPMKTRLEFKVNLPEQEMDFIVTAWVGRVAFEACEKADPMNWQKIKRTLQTPHGMGKDDLYSVR